MNDQKNKKKTLTISTNTSKKIDLSSLSSDGKKTFSIEKKTPFKSSRSNKSISKPGTIKKRDPVKKTNLLNNRQQKILLKKMKKQQLKQN
jgi:hypothetical protein